MNSFIIKLKNRGSNKQKIFDIVVMKQTDSPSSAPISKIGIFCYKLNNKYSFVKYDINLLSYWLKKKTIIHSNLLNILNF
jgi:ribosomal protein S16